MLSVHSDLCRAPGYNSLLPLPLPLYSSFVHVAPPRFVPPTLLPFDSSFATSPPRPFPPRKHEFLAFPHLHPALVIVSFRRSFLEFRPREIPFFCWSTYAKTTFLKITPLFATNIRTRVRRGGIGIASTSGAGLFNPDNFANFLSRQVGETFDRQLKYT